MSHVKHTPGPWIADRYGRVYGAPDERSKHKNGRPFIGHIVDIGGRHAPNVNKGSIDEVGKADSSLIAAAPELLKTLQELSFQFDGLLDCYEDDMDEDVYEKLSALAIQAKKTIIRATVTTLSTEAQHAE